MKTKKIIHNISRIQSFRSQTETSEIRIKNLGVNPNSQHHIKSVGQFIHKQRVTRMKYICSHSTKSEKQYFMHARNKYSVIMTSAAKERCFKKQNSYQVEIDNISFRCGGIRCTFIIELRFSCSSAS